MRKKTLPHLQSGDIVEIIAPAGRYNPEALAKLTAALAKWSLQARIPHDIFGADLFCANSKEKRFTQLQAALLNKDSKIIWCLRGGYGSMQLIPWLEKIKPPKQQKLFIGFSDITALNIFLEQRWGWTPIHGSGSSQLVSKEVSPRSIVALKKIFFQEVKGLHYALKPLNKLAEQTQLINAPIVGGNLTLVQNSLGTSWQINNKNKILLLEEVNERGYRIDRMLEQLQQAGIMDNAKAILLGDFTKANEPNGKSLVKQTLKRFADNCKLPVLQIAGVGHGQTNHPIILGYPTQLSLGKSPALTFQL